MDKIIQDDIGQVPNPGTEVTPQRKRKATGEDNLPRRAETNKKTRSTFTPKTQAGRPLKRTTPARSGKTTMNDIHDKAETPQPRPVLMNELKDCLGEWTGKLSDSLTKTLTAGLTRDFTKAVSVVAESVAKNTKNIDELQGAVKRIERDATNSNSKLEKKIDRLESVFLASRRSGECSPTPSDVPPCLDIMQVDLKVREQNIDKSEKYATSRRSIRLWPVRGNSEAEIRSETIRFIRGKLKIDEEILDDELVVRVRRSRPPRQSRVKFEVLVTLEDKFARDIISAGGKNLADYIDTEGFPTAGVRLDYPAHLGSSFRTLDWYGKEMRDKHGRGTRRNIKFDDDEESLYLDVCLPGEEYWHRITPEAAKRYKDELELIKTSNSRKSLEGPSRPRVAGGFPSSRKFTEGSVRDDPNNARTQDGYRSPEKRR